MRLVGHWMLRMCPQAWHCRYVPGAYETFAFDDFIVGSSLARLSSCRSRPLVAAVYTSSKALRKPSTSSNARKNQRRSAEGYRAMDERRAIKTRLRP